MNINLLFDAIRSNDLNKVRCLLESDEIKDRINCKNEYGHTPLILSMIIFDKISRSAEIFRILIENGAKLNVCDNQGNSPLMLAVKNRNIHLLREILKIEQGKFNSVMIKESNLEQVNDNGDNALTLAIKSKVKVDVENPNNYNEYGYYFNDYGDEGDSFEEIRVDYKQSLIRLKIVNDNTFQVWQQDIDKDRIDVFKRLIKAMIKTGIGFNLLDSTVNPILIAVKDFNETIRKIKSKIGNKHVLSDYHQVFLEPYLQMIKILAINGANLETGDEPLDIQIFYLINSVKADQILEDASTTVIITDVDVFKTLYERSLYEKGFNGDYPTYIDSLKRNKTIPQLLKNEIINKLLSEQNDFNLSCDSIFVYRYGCTAMTFEELFNQKMERGDDFGTPEDSYANRYTNLKFNIYHEIDPVLVTELKEYFFDNVSLTEDQIKELKSKVTSANIKLLTDNCTQILDQLFISRQFSDIETILNLQLPAKLKSLLPQIYQENCQKLYDEIIRKKDFKIEDTKDLILPGGVIKLFEANYSDFAKVYFVSEQELEPVNEAPITPTFENYEVDYSGDSSGEETA